jgi:hypothetical protein
MNFHGVPIFLHKPFDFIPNLGFGLLLGGEVLQETSEAPLFVDSSLNSARPTQLYSAAMV